jgi:hypothetical protein
MLNYTYKYQYVSVLTHTCQEYTYLYHSKWFLMNKQWIYVFFLAFILASAVSACKTKEGCGLEEKYKPDMETTKHGKSTLFTKKQMKRKR